MKSSFRLTRLLLVMGASPVLAHPFDDTLDDLPEVMFLVGDGERASGVVETYNIPVTDWPDQLQITLVGADGGRGKATTTAGADREGEGGGGASITGVFAVDPDDADSLRPGGELRFIVGNKGGSNSRSQVAGGGGGGGTGVIYRAPTEGAEWEILLVAGGGGGGVASTRVADTFGKDGGDANTETFGDDSGLDGGENGGRGGTYSSGAGGGGGVSEGWDSDDPSGGRAAGMTTASPTGGAGGSPFETGAEGGFGFGGGGAGYSKVSGLTFGGGGGGGGGYSGGGAGDIGKSSNNDKRGGGGGSYIDSRASGVVASTRSGNRQEGNALNVSHFFPEQPEKSLPGPTIVPANGTSTEVAYTESQGISVPTADATDYYGNEVTVIPSYPDGFINRVPGTYTMTFSATDQFGTTSTLEHTLILLEPLPPSFTLARSTISVVEDSGGYTRTSFASDIDTENEGVSFLGFTVTNDNNGLFSSQPAISNDGTLTFTPADEAYGSATVSVVGTNDITHTDDVSSDPQTFTITVTRDWKDDPPTDLSLSNQSVPEGTSVIGTITATSFPGDVVTFEIDETEGDAEEIAIDATSGELTFVEVPDYESPNDIGGNNRYRIEVFGTGEEGTVRRTFYIDVTNVNESPENITLSQNEVEENTIDIGTVTATDPEGSQVFFTLSGGDDASQVSIGYTSGVLTFRTAPDFENPSDANGDNIYEFNLRATDNSRSRTLAVQVIVTDADESALAVFRTTYGLASDGSDDGADWSGNGIANLQYFVFGLGDPNESSVDRSLLPTLSRDGESVTFSYRYAFPTEGFTVRGVTSTDLQSWDGFESLIGTDEEPLNADVEADGEGFLRVTTTFPIGSASRFFAVDVEIF